MAEQHPIGKLLGPELVRRDGSRVSTATALAGKKYVGVYFSASWCGPCKQFTPFLRAAYSTKLVAKGFEIVFVSSKDDDQASFQSYFDTMPWLAQPFDSPFFRKIQKIKSAPSIPMLYILDCETGKVVTRDGRSECVHDPKGERFPWPTPSFWDLIGDEFLQADGETIEADELKGEGKVIALYVAGSGRYERTCKQFSMHLATMYAAGLKDKGLEVILVPLDDDNASFTRHFQSHPWLAIPQGDRRVAKLLQHYKVESVPHLMLFDGATGNLINGEARNELLRDPTCQRFPWRPPPYYDLAVTQTQQILKCASICVFAEGCSEPAAKAAVVAALEAAAAAQDASGVDETERILLCLIPRQCGLGDQLRALTSHAERGATPTMVLIDITDDGAYYNSDAAAGVSAETLLTFIAAYKADTLQRMQMPTNVS